MIKSRTRRLRVGAALLGALLGMSVLAGLQVGQAPQAKAATAVAPSLSLQGSGWGHGRGMSQWGANGRALAGQTHSQILGFYYRGDRLEQRDFGSIRVRVGTGLSETRLAMSPTSTLSSDTSAQPLLWGEDRGDQVKLSVLSGQLQARYRDADGAWQAVVAEDWTPGTTVSLNSGDLAATVNTDGSSNRYRGQLQVRATPNTSRMDLINALNMEQYLYSVVTAEMPSSWPAQALRSQAVAARSYAQFNCSAGASYFDVLPTTACQVYRGHSRVSASGSVTSYEAVSVRAAVEATADQILTRNGAPVRTEFSSSNGGWTLASNGWPAQQDIFDAAGGRNPNADWSATVLGSAISGAWPAIGTFTGVGRVLRDGQGSYGGRVTSIEFRGDRGAVQVTGDRARLSLGLRSTLFSFSAVQTSELLVYDTRTGRQSVVDLNGLGQASKPLSETTWSKWDIVVPLEVDATPGTELLVYDTVSGRQTVVDLSSTGRASKPLSETTWSKWNVVVPLEVDGSVGSELLVYDTRSNRQTVVDLSKEGRASRPLSETSWSAWDIVVPIEVDGTSGSELLVYDSSTGRQNIVDLSSTGVASKPLSSTTWSGWDIVVPVEVDGSRGSELLVYDTDTGRQAVLNLDSAGNATTMSTTTWSAWNMVVPVEVDSTPGSEVLLYNTDTGKQAIVDLNTSGQASKPLSQTLWSQWDIVVPIEIG